MHPFNNHQHNPRDNFDNFGLPERGRGLIPRGFQGEEMGYPDTYPPQDNYGMRQEVYPVEPIQTEVQSVQQQAPSVIIEYDKKNPELPGKPTRDSVRGLANWYKMNGIQEDIRVKVSGTQIGSRELPPLFSQDVDFQEENFKKWVFEVMGSGVISEMPEPELPILRKIYGNLHVIEQMRLEKRQKDVTKGTITALTKLELDNKLKDFLGDKEGDPLEFREDIMTINTMIDDEKENGYLSDESIDYLFGCVLNTHILKQPGVTMTVVNNQPVIETGDTTKNAQWKSTLDTISFGRKNGVPGIARDNQTKIADYIAAYTYHNVDKNLTGYYTTLSQKAIGTNPDTTITEDVIKKSTLTNEEKTFLSQWVGQENRLGDIQIRQRNYVERAKENTRGKSWESLKKDFIKSPLTTIMQVSPVAGLAVGAAIIYGLVRLMVGEGKTSKFFGVITAILGGVAIVGNIGTAEKIWRETIGENLANGTTQAPRGAQNIGQDMREIGGTIGASFEKKWDRFSSLFTSSDDWSKLMLDERVGPKLIDKYPTGAILAVLNPDVDNKFNEDGKWRGTAAQETEIKEILSKLTNDEKRTLNTMLQETWTKYREANEDILTDSDLQKGKMRNMVDDLDTKYSWFNKIWRPAYWFDEASKEETLVEFTKDPDGWKNAKIGDLMVLWFSGTRTDLPVERTIPKHIRLLDGNIHQDRLESVQKNIQKIWVKNAPCDPEKTLGELLAKED